MIKKLFVSIFLVFSFALLFSGCGGSGGGSNIGGNASMTISMVDAPFFMSGNTVTAVNLGIDKVELIGNGAPVDAVSFSTPDVVNILNFTSQSSPLVFPTASIPPGSYNQIRLILDTATTTITVNGTTFPLFVPSGTQEQFGSNNSATTTDSGEGQGTAGVKVNAQFTAVSGGVYGFILDFNAKQSIVLTGSGTYIMKPVIVAQAVNVAGSLSGTVVNNANGPVSNALVEAELNGMVMNTGVTSSTGSFTINALAPGTYTLVVLNQYTTLAGNTETATGYDLSVGTTLNVPGTFVVTAGQNTDAGKITD